MSTPISHPNQLRPGIALVSISRMSTLCETVAPRYNELARFFSIRAGYGLP
jgi:propionate catabolism operon transcriptional regulator